MATKLDSDVVNDLIAALATTFDSGKLELRSGSPPADADQAATGTVVATLNLPADAFGSAAGGVISKAGTWEDTSADASATIGWYRLANGADTRRIDGTVTNTSGGGDMEVDNVVVNAGQQITITAYSLTMPQS